MDGHDRRWVEQERDGDDDGGGGDDGDTKLVRTLHGRAGESASQLAV